MKANLESLRPGENQASIRIKKSNKPSRNRRRSLMQIKSVRSTMSTRKTEMEEIKEVRDEEEADAPANKDACQLSSLMTPE